jgi:hypothetical protein
MEVPKPLQWVLIALFLYVVVSYSGASCTKSAELAKLNSENRARLLYDLDADRNPPLNRKFDAEAVKRSEEAYKHASASVQKEYDILVSSYTAILTLIGATVVTILGQGVARAVNLRAEARKTDADTRQIEATTELERLRKP